MGIVCDHCGHVVLDEEWHCRSGEMVICFACLGGAIEKRLRPLMDGDLAEPEEAVEIDA